MGGIFVRVGGGGGPEGSQQGEVREGLRAVVRAVRKVEKFIRIDGNYVEKL